MYALASPLTVLYIWRALNGKKDIFERFQSHSRTYVKSVFERTHRRFVEQRVLFFINIKKEARHTQKNKLYQKGNKAT